MQLEYCPMQTPSSHLLRQNPSTMAHSLTIYVAKNNNLKILVHKILYVKDLNNLSKGPITKSRGVSQRVMKRNIKRMLGVGRLGTGATTFILANKIYVLWCCM